MHPLFQLAGRGPGGRVAGQHVQEQSAQLWCRGGGQRSGPPGPHGDGQLQVRVLAQGLTQWHQPATPAHVGTCVRDMNTASGCIPSSTPHHSITQSMRKWPVETQCCHYCCVFNGRCSVYLLADQTAFQKLIKQPVPGSVFLHHALHMHAQADKHLKS